MTLKHLAAHKVRAVSTAMAVMLGVAFMAGTLVFTDTLTATFDNVVAEANEGVDAMVRAPSPVDLAYGQSGPRLDPAAAEAVAAVEGVDDVAFQLFGYAQLVGPDGTPVGDQAKAPAFGLNWVDVDTLNPYDLVAGSAPAAADEIVIDRSSARDTGYGIGDSVTVLSAVPPREFTIAGIASFAGADSAAGATTVLFRDDTAAELLSVDGDVDAIVATAAEGVTEAELVERISEAVSPEGVEVVTGAQVVAEDQAAFADTVGPFKVFMLVFAFVAMFVGAFIINNTFSITVAQRTKEMAMLRAVGASRVQVLRSILIEALLLGVAASAVGLGAGIAVARGLTTLMRSFGVDMPDGPTVIAANSMAIAFVIGVTVTVASAVLPARRGSRVPPLAALREVSVDRSGVSKRRTASGTALLGLGAITLSAGLRGSGIQLVGLGAFVTLIGVAVLAPVVAGPFTVVAGWPLRAIGISGEMAIRNAQRSAKRTARTASALMIGVALVSFITVLAASINTSFAGALDHDYRGTHVIDSGASDGRGGFNRQLADTLRATPGVRTVAVAQSAPVEIDGTKPQFFSAVDTTTIGELFDFGPTEGSLADLGADGIAVSADRAASKGWALGSVVTVGFPSGETGMVVRAIYDDETWFGAQLVSTEAFARHLPHQLDYRIYLDGDDAAVRSAATSNPSVDVWDRDQFAGSVNGQIDQILGIVYALLGLAVVISLVGIVNTLALSVHERTRELGLLRAVGMTRRQVASTIRSEAIVIATFGTVLGLAVGVFFGWATVGALGDQGIDTLTIPAPKLAAIAAIAAVAAGVAASIPARRGARLDVLAALSTQ